MCRGEQVEELAAARREMALEVEARVAREGQEAEELLGQLARTDSRGFNILDSYPEHLTVGLHLLPPATEKTIILVLSI